MKKYDAQDLSKYKASYLDCRPGMSGHRWVWQTDYKILRNGRGDIIEFSRLRKCNRCQTESKKVYNGKTGRLLRRSYTYPDGYTIDSNSFHLEAGMAALESLRRSLEGGGVEEEEQP